MSTFVLIPKVTAEADRKHKRANSTFNSALSFSSYLKPLPPWRNPLAHFCCYSRCFPCTTRVCTARMCHSCRLNLLLSPVMTKQWRNCLVWLWLTSMRIALMDTSLPSTVSQMSTCTLRSVQTHKTTWGGKRISVVAETWKHCSDKQKSHVDRFIPGQLLSENVWKGH